MCGRCNDPNFQQVARRKISVCEFENMLAEEILHNNYSDLCTDDTFQILTLFLTLPGEYDYTPASGLDLLSGNERYLP